MLVAHVASNRADAIILFTVPIFSVEIADQKYNVLEAKHLHESKHLSQFEKCNSTLLLPSAALKQPINQLEFGRLKSHQYAQTVLADVV